MKKYQIEDGVPIPNPRSMSLMATLRNMSHGQSVLVQGRSGSSVNALAHRASRERGLIHAVRAENGGYRI